MSKDLDDYLKDTAVWFEGNRRRIPRENLLKRIEFLEKTCACLIELVAIGARDLIDLEHRRLHPQLWLPDSVKIDNGPPIKLK